MDWSAEGVRFALTTTLNLRNHSSISEIPGHKHFTFGHLGVIEASRTQTR
jgi:hypothetical protein